MDFSVREDNTSDGWTGWAECGDLDVRRNGNTITTTSHHALSAQNDSDKKGNFECTFNHKSYKQLDDGSFDFKKEDTSVEPEQCRPGNTITEADLAQASERTTTFAGGAGGYKVEAYTRVAPKRPINGNSVKALYVLQIGIP